MCIWFLGNISALALSEVQANRVLRTLYTQTLLRSKEFPQNKSNTVPPTFRLLVCQPKLEQIGSLFMIEPWTNRPGLSVERIRGRHCINLKWIMPYLDLETVWLAIWDTGVLGLLAWKQGSNNLHDRNVCCWADKQEGNGPIDLRRQGPWEMDIWSCRGLIGSQIWTLSLQLPKCKCAYIL